MGSRSLFGDRWIKWIIDEHTIQSMTIKESVNHPQHYGGEDNVYEAIRVIEAHNLNFNLGNVVKYILRAEHKGKKIEDLKKGLWYLQREIGNLEKGK